VTSSAEIRIATSEDAKSALEYFAKLQTENLSTIFRVDPLPTLEEEVAFLRSFEVSPNSNWFAVVSDDGAIVGNLGIQADSRAQRSHVGHLGMSILSPFRSVGLGTRLWKTALSWAKSTDLRRIQLDVLETNWGAIRLYKRFGFSVDGRRPGDVLVAGDYVDMIQMSRAVHENAV
jgi:RimJ/RimL family protein N-acetyltransferase